MRQTEAADAVLPEPAILETKSFKHSLSFVEDIINKRRRTDPNAGWLHLPWLIQFWPVIRHSLGAFRYASSVNPAMEGLSGLIGCSKESIYNLLNPAYLPVSIYVDADTTENRLKELVSSAFPDFPATPVILKPDIGERSAGVVLAASWKQLFAYINESKGRTIVQQKLAGDREAGLTFYRNPDTGGFEAGSLVEKCIPRVTGDGSSHLQSLI